MFGRTTVQIPKFETLPPVCILCGLPANGTKVVRFSWADLHRGIIGLIIMLLSVKTETLKLPMCNEHLNSNPIFNLRREIWIWLLFILLPIPLMFMFVPDVWPSVLWLVMVLIGLINFVVRRSTSMGCSGIGNGMIDVSGVSLEFAKALEMHLAERKQAAKKAQDENPDDPMAFFREIGKGQN